MLKVLKVLNMLKMKIAGDEAMSTADLPELSREEGGCGRDHCW